MYSRVPGTCCFYTTGKRRTVSGLNREMKIFLFPIPFGNTPLFFNTSRKCRHLFSFSRFDLGRKKTRRVREGGVIQWNPSILHP